MSDDRQTGRTERALKLAIQLTSNGRVLVVVAKRQEVKLFEQRIRKMNEELTAEIDVMEAGRVVGHDIRGRTYAHFIFDHAVWDLESPLPRLAWEEAKRCIR